MHIIDRRPNSRGIVSREKSLPNRKRWIDREKALLRKNLGSAIISRKLGDMASPQEIEVEGADEPVFSHDRKTGVWKNIIFPGNRNYKVNDEIPRPDILRPENIEDQEEGESESKTERFKISLSAQEFYDLFLADMGLPNFTKADAIVEPQRLVRAGYSKTGSIRNIALIPTLRNALPRRWAHKHKEQINTEEESRLQEIIGKLIENGSLQDMRIAFRQYEKLRNKPRLKKPTFLDDIDLRHKRFEPLYAPAPGAVVFCLMDVSGSMDMDMRELAKRFFMLLYLMVGQRHGNVELVFIQHTDEASNVSQEAFFHDDIMGGTVIFTALKEMDRIIEKRYSSGRWNIYGAQASDGATGTGDSDLCAKILAEKILPRAQFFGYIQIAENWEKYGSFYTGLGIEKSQPSDYYLWKAYEKLLPQFDNMAIQGVAEKEDILKVFGKFFSEKDRQVIPATASMSRLSL